MTLGFALWRLTGVTPGRHRHGIVVPGLSWNAHRQASANLEATSTLHLLHYHYLAARLKRGCASAYVLHMGGT